MRVLLAAAALALWGSCGAPHAAAGVEPGAAPPPNVLLIVTDDQGWADVGVQGAEGFATPHLDRIAREGVRLTDFYVAQPVCSASRAAILTGCYPNRIGIRGALGPHARVGLHADETTIAELCRARGFATAIYGKWHLGHRPPFLPTRHGFDEWYGIPYSNDMWPRHPEAPVGTYPPLPLYEGEEVVARDPDQDRFTGDFARRADGFIRAAAARDQPFLVYLAHPMPHVPLHASEAFRGHTARGLYGDVIAEIDATTGMLLDTLDELGIADDTLVVFTSDNGPWLSYGDHGGSAGPLREGKGTTFEGGVRVPFLARWPRRIPAGTTSAEPAMAIDLLPTVAAAIGAPLPPRPIDGRDLLPLLTATRTARSPQEAYFFWYRGDELQAMRWGRWKLHFPHAYRSMEGRVPGRGGEPGKYDYGRRTGLELYDLSEDPGEERDVAAARPQVVRRMQELADDARARLGDALQDVEGRERRPAGRVVE